MFILVQKSKITIAALLRLCCKVSPSLSPMKQLMLKYSFLPLLVLLTSCWKEPVYPVEPSITFNSIKTKEIIEESGSKRLSITIALDFKDGDGDLGLSPDDTLAPYDFSTNNKFHNNYFVEAFVEINNEFQPYNPSAIPFSGRYIPLNPDGKKQSLEGELRYPFDIFPGLLPLEFKNGDHMKFRIQIADRALNLSNTIETEPIQVFF
jgi:hypothetical protein